MYKLQIILILLLLSINSSAKVSFKAYTSDDGLTHNTVFSIGQDGDGFMWFGTAYGVSRFDGNTLDLYNLKTDPAEQNNVAMQNKVLAIRLRKDMLQWFNATRQHPCVHQPDIIFSQAYIQLKRELIQIIPVLLTEQKASSII